MDILQPLYEFGALLRYLEENGKAKERLMLHTKYKDLSHIYYKAKENLSEEDASNFEAYEEIAYCRFVMNLDKELEKLFD